MIAVPTAWQHALGWALVHSLWQGAVIAALLALVLRAGRSAPARVRYAASCVALAALLAAPACTFAWIARNGDRPPAIAAAGADALHPERWSAISLTVGEAGDARPAPAASTPVLERRAAAWERAIPWIVRGWVAGVLLLSLRLLGAWVWVQRLRRRALVAAPAEWTAALERLRAQLGIRRRVELFLSPHVSGPSLVGWLRPVVLMPLSLSSGLTPRQVEIFLLHELLHVRRWDYLVNLLQRVAEVVLFYHPATWWVSARIRAEREHCCDDAVAARSGVRDYVAALLALETARAPARALALGAADASLVARVRRLVDPRAAHSPGRAPLVAAGLAPLALAAVLAAAPPATDAHAREANPAGSCARPGSGTTLCPELAGTVDSLLRQAGVPGLVIVQEVGTGAVLAYAQTGPDGGSMDALRPVLPASLWKLAIAAVWWDRGLPTAQMACPASVRVGERTVGNWGGGALGMLNAPEEVLVHSCNTAAVEMALRLGRDGGAARLAADLRRIGFPVAHAGERPTVDTSFWASRSPDFRSRMAPLAATIRVEDGTPEAMANLALATSSVRLTPLHLSRFLQAVGNGGVMRAPTLEPELAGAGPGVRVMSDETARRLQHAMLRTVEEGTARAAAGSQPGTWRLGGKTGTAQGAPGGAPDGWFGGLVVDARGQPRYTVLVHLRGSGPGGDRSTRLAARIARTLAESHPGA